MTFTEKQQKESRAAFIAECRQKAWGAACNADWIRKNLDELLAQFTKLEEQDLQLEADVKELESALDSHTVDNRNKRKALNGKRGEIVKQKEAIAGNAQQAQRAMQQLLQSVETALALAAHAEGWEWKEAESKGTSDIKS